MQMTKEKRDAIVCKLYDKCALGEISRNQREQLIQKVNCMFEYVEDTDTTAAVEVEAAKCETEKCNAKESAVEEVEEKAEKCEDSEECEEPKEESDKKASKLSPKEKYELFKDAVFKKCDDGEITEEFRDELMEKASKKFLPKED